MLAITAEGPSSDIMNQRENPTGHTYLAPEMYAERLKDGLRRAEQRELEACAEADELRTDAERYRKLKAYSDECKDWQWSDLWEQPNLDSAVDALPEPSS